MIKYEYTAKNNIFLFLESFYSIKPFSMTINLSNDGFIYIYHTIVATSKNLETLADD